MTYIEALAELINGKRIRMVGWNPDVYLCKVGNEIKYNNESTLDYFLYDNFINGEWEVYSKKMSELKPGETFRLAGYPQSEFTKITNKCGNGYSLYAINDKFEVLSWTGTDPLVT